MSIAILQRDKQTYFWVTHTHPSKSGKNTVLHADNQAICIFLIFLVFLVSCFSIMIMGGNLAADFVWGYFTGQNQDFRTKQYDECLLRSPSQTFSVLVVAFLVESEHR